MFSNFTRKKICVQGDVGWGWGGGDTGPDISPLQPWH